MPLTPGKPPAIFRFSFLVLYLLILPACSQKQAPAPLIKKKLTLKQVDRCPDPGMAPESDYDESVGVVYDEKAGKELKLDLRVPKKGKGPYPLVIYLHGGGWTSGRYNELFHEVRMAVALGFAGATVQYRLANTPDGIFPAPIQDVRCAIRFLKAKAQKYNLDPRRVVVAGFSAGGHLAALTAAAGEDKKLDGQCKWAGQPVAVSAAVAYFSPLDLRPHMGRNVPEVILSNLLGAPPTEKPALAAQASPAAYLTPDDPPFMLVHGTADHLVPPDLSRNFKWTLDRMKIPNVYVELKGVGHGFYMFKGGPQYKPSTCTAVAFLREVMGEQPSK